MLCAVWARCKVRGVTRGIEVLIVGLDGIRIDRNLFTRMGLEKDDPCVATLAARDAALVGFVRIIEILEAH